MKQHLLALMLMLFGATVVFGQQNISGRVSDRDGEPLIGASIMVKGTTNGTVSDIDGKFKISAPADATLVLSYTGFSTLEVPVNNQTDITVTMQPGIDLTEVLVTGYGTAIKRDLTGNISKIRTQDIKDMPVTSFDQAMQGKAAGVQITAGNGKLGQAVQIRVRGQSSVSASNEPLIVIDGIPATTGDLGAFGGATNPLSDINPQDIESIEILKDASAAAIYGARAANGVVLVTTKRGKSGRTNVSYGFQYGKSNPARQLEFLNTEQYLRLYRQAAANADRIDGLEPTDPSSASAYMEDFFVTQSLGTLGTAQAEDTNWGELAYQDAPMQQHDLNISGGNEKTTFYMSGQWFDQKGILIGNALNRISGRINLDHQAYKWLKVGFNMGLSRSFNERISGDRQFDNPMQMVALPPMTPATDPDTGLPVGTPPGDISIPVYYNPLINLGNAYYNTNTNRNLSSVYAQISILDGLSFRSEFALDMLDQQEELYYNSKTQRNFGAPQGIGQNLFTRVENYNTNNYFTYNTGFGRTILDLTAGMAYQQSQQKTNFTEGQDFPSDAYRMIASAARKTDGSSTESNFRFLSYFARANVKLSDKYLLGVSVRTDGSSRFGNESRYGFFPAASLGWIVSEEGFLSNNKTISFLKLRASYGRTGNAEIGNFPQLGLFAGDAAYNGAPGQRPSQLANPDLSWETTDQFDAGIDFGLFKDRLTGEIDFYSKNTSGLLLNVNVPATSGFTTQTRNIGQLTNRGIEVVLNTDVVRGDFRWKTSLNFAANKNEITDLQGQIIEAGLNVMSRAVEGQPLGTYFTAEYAGVDPANGNALWYKNATEGNRETTSTYSQAQRVVVGSPLPDWIGGVTNTFSYKGLELSVLFSAVIGNELNFYGVGRFSSANARFEDNQTVDQLAAWTPENPNTNVPEARLFFNNGAQPSSRFIQDGSFVRLRNATLSYNFPKSITSKIKIQNLRVYVTGQNLLTWTNYIGWDPEVNADDIVTNIAQGYDFYTAPQPRTILAGVNIGF
ncbi:SusC/RagA family TonB-linked outer membrane protein [Haliscomenobacter hydrossis]|uniref:TonB-dependent receptor plug n=1 Tax=Haliscomenobacter hydrossis (strain ATCC 27775 / DSM 1100 / LMG 10767 / O) TaxID=760192 RepID=F4KTI8_HALH1|nr:TonB-dependent receptor [Haliscomenobacter hydrossis]AEE52402.1 TonB-dependent receptor plug [Haliscomenobacter hydrossis DSM 1100]